MGGEGVLNNISNQVNTAKSKDSKLHNMFSGERTEVIAVLQRYKKYKQFIRKQRWKEDQLRSRLKEAEKRQKESVDELRKAREKWKQEVYDSRKRSEQLIGRLARARRIEKRSHAELQRERADLQQRLREEGKVSSEKDKLARFEGNVHDEESVEQDLQRKRAKLSQQIKSLTTTGEHMHGEIKNQSGRLIAERERLEHLEAEEMKVLQAGYEQEKQVRQASQRMRAMEKAVEKQVRNVEERERWSLSELRSGREEFAIKASRIKKLLLQMNELGVRKRALADEVEKERQKEVKVSQDTNHVLERLKEEKHHEAVEQAILARRLANSIKIFRNVSRDRHHRRERQAEMRARETDLKKQYKNHLFRYFQKRAELLKQKKLVMRRLGHQRILLGSLVATWAKISKTLQKLRKKSSKVPDIFATWA